MAAFTAKDVKALREKTGCGMMDCKNALTEADGNMEKATELLREKGLSAAAKKAGRIAAEGIVQALVDEDKQVAAIVEINSETDFVAKNADFIAFVDAVTRTIIAQNPADLAALEDCKLDGSNDTVGEALRDKILVIGENMKLRRFARHEGLAAAYVHGEGRIGVLVQLEADAAVAKKEEFQAFGKDIAMQIAAINPQYTSRDDIPAEQVEKEKEFLTAQALAEGKPQHIAEKMVLGRMGKFYKDICLLEQPYIKDGDITVTDFVKNTEKALGGAIKVTGFIRYERGEGLEKREENFADEVAGMMK